MVTNSVVLLQKIRQTNASWVYVYNNQKYVVHSDGDIFNQFLDAMIDIQSNVEEGTRLVVISPTFIKRIEATMRDLFPEVTFITFDGANMRSIFRRAFHDAMKPRTSVNRVLYIGADASGGHHDSLSAWAWCSSGVDGSYGMGVCMFKNNNYSEFEGILRGIVENRESPYARLHVYSDSKNAIDFFTQTVVDGEMMDSLKDTYLVELIEEAREVCAEKKVTIEWVRGHRSHRLNQTADYISRLARKGAQSGRNLRTIQIEADALFEMFNRLG